MVINEGETFKNNFKDKLIIPKTNAIRNISKKGLVFYAILLKALILNKNNIDNNVIKLSSRSIMKLTGLSRYFYLKYLDELSENDLLKYEIYSNSRKKFIYKIHFLEGVLDYDYLKNNYKM